MKKILTFFLFLIIIFTSAAQDNRWRTEAGILVTHFQQQVKPKVGEPRGERLVNEFQLGLLLSGTYSFTDYFAAGLFLRIDRGERAAAVFDRFEDGKAVTESEVGGVYNEFWFGPLLQFRWKLLSAEIGYALVGIRDDDGRRDIPSATGNNSDAFTTLPAIAWLFSIGGNFPVMDNFDIIIKIEYRNRYYNERGGEPLVNDIEHGTQSISPVFGVGWSF
ncbi:MAG: hypothetical protein R6W90_18450 [Ignavibacteriaceae bacterium]